MRKMISAFAVVALVATPVFADAFHGAGYSAGIVDYDRVSIGGNFYQGQGGEFSIRENNIGDLTGVALEQYASFTKNQWTGGGKASFQSFCIEINEHVSGNMQTWVSTEGKGTEAGETHAWEGGTGDGDNLDYTTAYLYHQFATGQLAGYDYENDGIATGGGDDLANRGKSAGALQRLIWWIEEQRVAGDPVSNAFSNFHGINPDASQDAQIQAWWNEALAAVADSNIWGQTIGNVRVMQTFVGTDGLRQDQIVLIPAPGAALLGTIGMVSLLGLRRRRAA